MSASGDKWVFREIMSASMSASGDESVLREIDECFGR